MLRSTRPAPALAATARADPRPLDALIADRRSAATGHDRAQPRQVPADGAVAERGDPVRDAGVHERLRADDAPRPAGAVDDDQRRRVRRQLADAVHELGARHAMPVGMLIVWYSSKRRASSTTTSACASSSALSSSADSDGVWRRGLDELAERLAGHVHVAKDLAARARQPSSPPSSMETLVYTQSAEPLNRVTSRVLRRRRRRRCGVVRRGTRSKISSSRRSERQRRREQRMASANGPSSRTSSSAISLPLDQGAREPRGRRRMTRVRHARERSRGQTRRRRTAIARAAMHGRRGDRHQHAGLRHVLDREVAGPVRNDGRRSLADEDEAQRSP